MRTLFFLLSILSGFVLNASPTIPVNKSTIEKVNVFLSGAEIVRSFTVPLTPGLCEILVSNISSDLDPASLVITAPDGVRVLSGSSYADREAQLKYKSATIAYADSLQAETLNQRLRQSQLESFKAELDVLLVNAKRVGTSGGISLNELDQTLSYMRKKQDEIHALILNTETLIKASGVKIARYNQGYLKSVEDGNSIATVISIIAESSVLKNASFRISYYISSCGWAPVYTIFSNGTDTPITLEYKGEVLNNSGESWDNIPVTLIAGNPSRTLTAPQLETWVLSYRQNKRSGKVYGYESLGNEGTLSAKQIKGAENSSYDPAATQEIELEEGQIIFDIPGKHSIPSLNKPYTLDISKTTVQTSYRYKAVPKIDNKAYLIASILDWEALRLIEGDASIFLNNTFMGKTYIDPLSAGDTLELSLGPDPNIQITRVKKKDFSSRKLIGLQLVESFTYEIDVRNLNKSAIDIEIVDQLPISQQSEIEVREDELSGAAYQPGNGMLTWKLSIPPSKNSKIKIGYTVKYPKDKIVVIKRTGRVICPKFR